MKIRQISTKDIDTILQLNKISVKVLSPLDKSQLLELIEMAALSVVIEADNEIAGFLLCLTNGQDYSSINYQWFDEQFDSFLYIDRVVVSEKFRGRGVASTFYHFVLDWASNNNYPSIVAEIDVKPPNEASLLFHKKFGFKELELLTHSSIKMVSLQELKVKTST